MVHLGWHVFLTFLYASWWFLPSTHPRGKPGCASSVCPLESPYGCLKPVAFPKALRKSSCSSNLKYTKQVKWLHWNHLHLPLFVASFLSFPHPLPPPPPPPGLTGISGDKVEIDPVTNQKASTKFWIKQKPISIDSDLLCACDLAEEKSPSE